jgi:hypothetical protein
VDVVWHQSPGVTRSLCLDQNITETIDKFDPIPVITKYQALFDTSGNDVVQGSGCINSGLSWHVFL